MVNGKPDAVWEGKHTKPRLTDNDGLADSEETQQHSDSQEGHYKLVENDRFKRNIKSLI